MSNSVSNGDVNPQKWTEIFEEFEKDYKDAYYAVEKAVKLDEEEKLSEALPFYEFGLSLINKALDMPLTEPSKPDLTWEKAVAMMQKLKKTRKEVMIRIENNKSKPQLGATELPPSYEEATASSKPESLGTSNMNGNCSNNFQLPGPSKTDLPYIPSSALRDEKLLANLHNDKEGSSNASVTYSDLSHQLKEMKLAKNEEILFRHDNVQMYFIAPDGRVSSTSEPSTMIIARVYDATSKILNEALINIVNDLYREIHETKKKRHKHSLLHKKHHRHHKNKKFNRRKDETSDPPSQTFLQVDSWVYPLIPSASFCIRSAFGAFILPDINSNVAGAAVGLIVPEDVQDEVHELFSKILNESSPEETSRKRTVADFKPDKNSSKFLRGTAYLAHNLIKGASSAAQFLDSSTPKIINRINPQPEPQAINPVIQKTVQVAKTATEKAVNVTDYLATKVCSATLALGRYLSPYVQKQGSQLLAYTTNTTQEEAMQKINSLMGFTSDTLEGVSILYNGLETASSILSRSLANNTVQIIEYKYGQAAGALTSDAINAVENVYYTHHNFKYLKPKGLAKSALKGTGQALLEDHKKSKMSVKPHEFQNAEPGAGSGTPPST